jgi:hypothetical protein
MEATANPASRKKRPKGASGPSRRKPAVAGGFARVRRTALRLAVIGGASTVFLAAFILDPDAVARLLWACLTGHAGLPARLAAFAIVLAVVYGIALMLRPSAASPPPVVRKRAPRRPVANSKPIEQIEPAGETPVAGTPSGKRRKRKSAGTG